MIDFPCKCGFSFSVPEDQAGGLIQCPKCSLLADIPTLGDLANLNPDGTFAFEESLQGPDTTSAADLHRVFTNKTTDSYGREKDLRPTSDYLKNVGVQEMQPLRVAPRYDPDTGELIRPLQLKDEAPVPVLSIAEEVDLAEGEALDVAVTHAPMLPIPVAKLVDGRPPSLGYAAGLTRKQVTFGSLPLELFQPANTIVMFFLFVIYLAGYFTTLGLGYYSEMVFNVVQPFLLLNIPVWFIIAHLGCVIEDTGPDAIEEMPRPMRNFSLGEDFFNPIFRTVLAGVLCFTPLVLVLAFLNPKNPITLPIDLTFAIAGAVIFPGVLLTAVAGTTVLNLRPDRVASVIRLSGGPYVISVLLFILGAIPSVYYLAGELLFPQQLTGAFFGFVGRPFILLPAIIFAVYMLHYFGWQLGLLYRAHHDQFPWLAQRHIKKPRSHRQAAPLR